MRIGQLNCVRSLEVMAEHRTVAEDLALAILCVQEPYSLGARPVGLPVRSRWVSSGPNPMAALLVLDAKVGVLRLEHVCSRHTAVAEVSLPRLSFVLDNQYYQFADAPDVYLGELREVVRAARGRPVVAVMDANARSPIWGSHDTCERGEAFENIILDCNLYLLNDPAQGPTTYERPGARSFIDLSLVSASILHKVAQWEVHPQRTLSDHNLISFKIEVEQRPDEVFLTNRWAMARADWEAYESSVDNALSQMDTPDVGISVDSKAIPDSTRTSI